LSKQNEIKVFKANSKQADFTVRSITPEAGAKKLGAVLDAEASAKVRSAFRSLKRLGADSLAFHHQGRKIKVELAQAA
jgi:hypothetical protein